MALCFKVMKRYVSTTTGLSNIFNHVTVIGGGLMGSGIAQVTAQSGIDCTVIEVNEEGVQKSDANIKSSMQRVAKKLFQNSSVDAEKYIAETMGRLKISTDLQEAVAKSDLVIEAIVENLNTKQKLFAQIDTIAPEHTIFASNTSSIPITEIASVTVRKDRFGGLHFFNPVPVMKLLEVIKTDDLSEESYQKLLAWGKAIGKTCITCKDTPGFVVNRLLVPYLAEAIRMLERRIATAKDIDVAMKLGAGYPMGPLELLDYVGLDTTKYILDGWHKKYPDNPLFTPIPMLEKLVSQGKLGKKTREGFYSYKKNVGTFPIPLHCPYFQPNSGIVVPPAQVQEETTAKEQPKPAPPKQIPATKPEVSEPAPEPVKKPVKMLKVEKVDRVERVDKLDKVDRMDKTDKMDKMDRMDRIDRMDRMDRTDRMDRMDRMDKLDKMDKMEKVEKLERQRKHIHKVHAKPKPKFVEFMPLQPQKEGSGFRKPFPSKAAKHIEEYLRDSLRQAKKSKMRRTSLAP